MDYSEISGNYLQVRKVRLGVIAERAYIRSRDIEAFVELEDRMNSGELGEDWLRSFHMSNDTYMGLLHKILKAAVKVGEPMAEAKLEAFIEEKGAQGPAVFLTPWETTLAYLDKSHGSFEEVASFYGVPPADAAA